MGWLSGLVQFVIAIPKIWSIIKDIQAALKRYQEQQKEKAHEDAVRKLKDARTEDEIKDAMRDLARNR